MIYLGWILGLALSIGFCVVVAYIIEAWEDY